MQLKREYRGRHVVVFFAAVAVISLVVQSPLQESFIEAYAQSGGPSSETGSVIPLVIEEDLQPGQSVSVTKEVTAPRIPPKLDMLLLQDETNSFDDDLIGIQGSQSDCSDGLASQVFDELVAEVPDLRAGVAGFRDFARSGWGVSGDHVYRLLQDLTPDKQTWLGGICSLGADGGQDIPEAQLAALKTAADGSAWDSNGDGDLNDPNDTTASQNPSWRSDGVTRVIILVTDAPFHVQGDSGGWPGPTFAQTVQALQAENIRVVVLATAATSGEYQDLASETGGNVNLISTDSSDIVSAVLSALEELTLDIWHETSCNPSLEVTLDPEVQLGITGGMLIEFNETISVSPDAQEGLLECSVTFFSGEFPEHGAVIAQQAISVNVFIPEMQPVADDQTVEVDEDLSIEITLTGTDPNGDPISFIIVDDPFNGSLSNLDSETGLVTYTPHPDFNGADGFTFRVTDGELESDTATVTINVIPVNDPPIADAGTDRAVNEGTTLTLDARGSSDPADDDALSFSWTQTAGIPVSLIGASTDRPSFTAPQVNVTAVLTFLVTVSDGADEDKDTVNVTVLDVTRISATLTQAEIDGAVIANATVGIGDLAANQNVAIDFENDVLGNVKIDSVSFALSGDSEDLELSLTASTTVLEIQPPADVEVALFLDFTPTSNLDLSLTDSFSNLPQIVFEVPKTDGLCEAELFLLDETRPIPVWIQLDRPIVLVENEDSCVMLGTAPHFSKFSVGGLKRATSTGGGGIDWEIVDIIGPSIIEHYWDPKSPTAGQGVTVYARITDDVGIEEATMFYHTASDDYRKKYSISMKRVNDHWFNAKISDDHVETPSFRFEINAIDFGGNEVKSDKIEVKVEPGIAVVTKASSTNLPAHVLASIEAKDVFPGEELEIVSASGAAEITSYPEEIIIKNVGEVPVDNIRVMLSPEIAKSFKLSHTAIPSIAPNENMTIALELNGNPNRDMFGSLVGYSGELIVVAEHSSPMTMPVNIGKQKSYFLAGYIDRVASIASMRYNKISLINNFLSSTLPEDENLDVSMASGAREINSVSDKLIIKNNGDEPLKNIRIIRSSLGSSILFDKFNIRSIEPDGSVTIQLLPRIDGGKYSPRDYTGEVIIAADNSIPQVIPIRIAAPQPVNSMEEYDVDLQSEEGIIRTAFDTIRIANSESRSMHSVKMILSGGLERVFYLTQGSLPSISAGEEIFMDIRMRPELGDKKNLFMQEYKGEITIVSEHHNFRKIPVEILWNKTESQHFAVYSRVGSEGVSNIVIDTLEKNYQKISDLIGEPSSKTVVYIADSLEEMRIVNESGNSYYSYVDDTIFICACEKPEYNAVKQFIHRLIIRDSTNYSNMKILTFNGENWLVDGMSGYLAMHMLNEGMDMENYQPIIIGDLMWDGSGSSSQYASTFAFFEFLEERYGQDVIQSVIDGLDYSITLNHKCASVEECAILNSVYEAQGWDLDKRRYSFTFSDLLSEWEDYLRG